MITLTCIIILLTIIKWLMMWDESIKQKKPIIEFYPQKELFKILLFVTTFFTAFVFIILILIYLP